jgi:GTP cyclohydrolase I
VTFDGPPGVAVVRSKVLVQVGQVEEAVDLAQQVILRHYVIEVKGVKEQANYLIDRLLNGVFQHNRPKREFSTYYSF